MKKLKLNESGDGGWFCDFLMLLELDKRLDSSPGLEYLDDVIEALYKLGYLEVE